jgi:chemosensory pili system protein ChpC
MSKSHPARQVAEPATKQAAEQDIRGVLIQLAGARLLLPNATIAEVLSYADPDPVEATSDWSPPDWLLGRIRWRGWQLPLVAFSRLAGIAGQEQGGLGSKVLVFKALGGNPRLPFFAVLTQGFPRLVTVSRAGVVVDDAAELPTAVLARVILNEDQAYVPDLEAVEKLIAEAVAQAA